MKLVQIFGKIVRFQGKFDGVLSLSGTLGFWFRVRVASGFWNIEKFGFGLFRAYEIMKSSGSGSFGFVKMPQVRVGFSGSGKPDPSLLSTSYTEQDKERKGYFETL